LLFINIIKKIFCNSQIKIKITKGITQGNGVGINVSVVDKANDKKKNLVANLSFIKNGVLPRKNKKNANVNGTLNVKRLFTASKVFF